MAKEQLAVIEMITNMILGKTDGVRTGFPARYTGEPGCLFRETETFTK